MSAVVLPGGDACTEPEHHTGHNVPSHPEALHGEHATIKSNVHVRIAQQSNSLRNTLILLCVSVRPPTASRLALGALLTACVCGHYTVPLTGYHEHGFWQRSWRVSQQDDGALCLPARSHVCVCASLFHLALGSSSRSSNSVSATAYLVLRMAVGRMPSRRRLTHDCPGCPVTALHGVGVLFLQRHVWFEPTAPPATLRCRAFISVVPEPCLPLGGGPVDGVQ